MAHRANGRLATRPVRLTLRSSRPCPYLAPLDLAAVSIRTELFMPQHWRVILLLSLVTGVAYLVRADVAVAQERMVPAVGLTMIGMGAIKSGAAAAPRLAVATKMAMARTRSATGT